MLALHRVVRASFRSRKFLDPLASNQPAARLCTNVAADENSRPTAGHWSPSALLQGAKATAQHYWHGTKLLAGNTRVASKLTFRMLKGKPLARQEHKFVVTALADLARVVPLVFFVAVPFAELALPLALKVFPNLLPSTFADKDQALKQREQLVQARLEVSKVVQAAMREKAEQAEASESVTQLVSTLTSLRETGRTPSPDALLDVMRAFRHREAEHRPLELLSRRELGAMASFVGLPSTYPTPALRLKLRRRLKALRREDRAIAAEGVESVSEAHLREDLRNRGLPVTHLDEAEMRTCLRDWLSLSQQLRVPMGFLLFVNMLQFEQRLERSAGSTPPHRIAAQDHVNACIGALREAATRLQQETESDTRAERASE